MVLADGESTAMGYVTPSPNNCSTSNGLERCACDLVELINVTNEPANELDDLVIF